MLHKILADAASMSLLEATAVVLAIAYLVLAIRQNILCWAAALISSLLYVVIFIHAHLYMESAVNVFYAVMAVYGWYEWRYGGGRHEGVRINVWPWRYHAAAIAMIAVLTGLFGVFLTHTSEASPYVDSFTTVGAIVTTFMVARKVLENWYYWFVIDTAEVYLFLTRELYLTTLLFIIYLVLVVVGLRDWLQDYNAETAAEQDAAY